MGKRKRRERGPARAPWTAEQLAKWRQLIASLREKFPIGPVRVWRVAMQGHGTAIKHKDHWRIYIARHRDYSTAWYDLTEEWAHALVGHDFDKHSIPWAVQLAAIRTLEDSKEL